MTVKLMNDTPICGLVSEEREKRKPVDDHMKEKRSAKHSDVMAETDRKTAEFLRTSRSSNTKAMSDEQLAALIQDSYQ